MKKNNHIGPSLDALLTEKGVFEETQAQAIKEMIPWQLSQTMGELHISKRAMATRLNTSRALGDRILDPKTDLTMSSLQRAAAIMGRQLKIELM
ncbi:MAG: Fis family transcriptional regulator [Nitrospira sp.]